MLRSAKESSTPTPWAFTMITEGRGRHAFHRPYITAGEEIICQIVVHGNDGQNICAEDKANAAFIVRAVNAHEGFIDLARALIERGPDATIGESLIESASHWLSVAEGSK